MEQMLSAANDVNPLSKPEADTEFDMSGGPSTAGFGETDQRVGSANIVYVLLCKLRPARMGERSSGIEINAQPSRCYVVAQTVQVFSVSGNLVFTFKPGGEIDHHVASPYAYLFDSSRAESGVRPCTQFAVSLRP